MPCESEPPYGYYDDLEKSMKKRLDKVTRMLCAIARSSSKQDVDRWIQDVPDFAAWWKRHQQLDRARKAKAAKATAKKRADAKRRAAKAAALKRLSARDRKALGL